MTIEEAAAFASVLGNTVRLTILQLLLQSRPLGLVVGEIQRAVDVPGSTLSHHLERLRDAGLVTTTRQGTFLWYRPVPERVAALAGWLMGLSGRKGAARKPEALPKPQPAPEIEIEVD